MPPNFIYDLIASNHRNNNYYSEKEIITYRMNFAKKIFFLKNGIVKISTILENGDEVILLILTSGDFFGSQPMIDSFFNDYKYTALRNHTEITALNMIYTQDIWKKNESIKLDFLVILGRQYKELETRIKTLSLRNAEQRLINVLLEFKTKFGHSIDKNNNIIIFVPLNQDELSNYIRVTRVTINKLINKLKRNLLIELQCDRLILKKEFFEYYRF